MTSHAKGCEAAAQGYPIRTFFGKLQREERNRSDQFGTVPTEYKYWGTKQTPARTSS